MRQFLIIFCSVVFLASAPKANAQEPKQDGYEKSDVKLIYFHLTRRCATCNAVEKVAKEAIDEKFKGEVEFLTFNLDEAEGEQMGNKYQVSGQSLLLVSADQRLNLTNEAFLNARSKPDKLKEIIQSKTTELLQ